MSRFKTNRKTNLVLVSCILSVVALVSAIFGIFTPALPKDTGTLGRFDWEIGNINAEGKVVESFTHIYSKDLVDVNKMNIDVSDDSTTLTYQVVFYDEDKTFVSMTEELWVDFDGADVPEDAKYFRVVVTPIEIDNAPVQINFFNMAKYINQIEVTFGK